MFESLVANLLNRFLGSYLENFDPKQLNIGIWSGDVKLTDLRLKKESLDKFKLPIDVKFGHLGVLTLQIPWSNLKSKPVRIIIEDLYILASPIILRDYDAAEEEQRSEALKQEKLQQLETLLQAQTQNQQLSDDLLVNNETFTESLITKIVDNLQVTIKNIHIRYEDDSVLTESPYSIGLTLKELSAVSTDENWTASFISITQRLTHKLLTLSNLSCYMNQSIDFSTIYVECKEGGDYTKLLECFEQAIDYDKTLEYLLKPVTGHGKVKIHKPGTTETIPHIKTELFFQEFSVELNSQQYNDILWTASKFHWYMRTFKFRKFRPKLPPNEAPKQWFKYAAQSILDEIHERNYKWSWEYFEKRRNQRIEYKKLWRLKLAGSTNPQDIQSLIDLERELPYEDIKFYRSLTRNDLRKEKQDSFSLFHNVTKDVQSGGWFSGWWGGSATTEEPKDTIPDEDTPPEKLDLSLSEEQRKALYEAIEYDENLITAVDDIPREWVKLEIVASLYKGGLTIKQESNLAEIIFEGCQTQIYQRSDSFLSCFQIQEFRVEDGTGTSLYKHIVSVKQAHSQMHDDSSSVVESGSSIQDEPFFQISFENNPLDNSADSILLGKLKSMTIFYNTKFIEEIIKFFTPPKIHLDTVGAIMNAAEATVEGITSQTRIGLQYALEEHKTINVKLDLQAPLIIMPLDPASFKSPVAILDAGHISVISELVDSETIQDIKNKQSYTDEDWKKLQELMYDKFKLSLEDVQFLVGPNIKSTMEQLHSQEDAEQSALMLDNFNLQLMLGVSILPDAITLPKFKVSGTVPQVKLDINDFQYKTMMQIIDAAIPNVDVVVQDESSVFNAFASDNTEVKVEEEVEQIEKKPVSSSQHIFEFDFDVDMVHVSLSRCINGVTLQAEPLIDLIGNGLNLQFYNNSENNIHVDLYLSDIELIDHIETTGLTQLRKLISSTTTSHRKLLQISYDRTPRIVEFNGGEIEVFDQDIKLQIATVKFIISRKSILSILNFVLNTFTDPNAQPTIADELKHNEDEETAPQKIKVDVSLDSIIIDLDEDGMKLATIQLSSAFFNVLVLPESLDVRGKLGGFTVFDDETNSTRELITMEGDNIAGELVYKTFDPETNINPYSSLVEFKTGAMTINFIESSFNRILSYLSQFLRMKAIYDRAREAAINQANQMDDKIKFNLLIKAPTIVFPTTSNNKLISNLGEFYAHNEYSQDEQLINVIETGIRNVSLWSELYFEEEPVRSQIVKELDIAFNIDYLEKYTQGKPTFVINGKMPELDLHLTELQSKMLMQLSDSLTRAITFDDNNLDDIEQDAAYANEVLKHNTQLIQGEQPKQQQVVKQEIPKDHQLLSLKFDVPGISLTVYNHTFGVVDIQPLQLSSFSMNKFMLQIDMNQDNNFKLNLKVKSFVVKDVRQSTSSKFSVIIPSADDVENQFVLSAFSEGTTDNITMMLTVEKPKTILALDYLFELQAFVNKATTLEEPVHVPTATRKKSISSITRTVDALSPILSRTSGTSRSRSSSVVAPPSSVKFGFSVNVIEPSVILLADDTREDTEAIVFKVEQILITKQNITSLAANNIGMYLSVMNDFDCMNYRIIDDFSISFALDDRGSTTSDFSSRIQVSIDPLVVGVSLRDIRLALNIFNRANELYNKAQEVVTKEIPDDNEYRFSEDFKKKLSQYAPSIVSTLTNESRESIVENVEQEGVVIMGEEFSASVGGVRFVLIGDVSELPVLDINVKPFELKAINWSTDLNSEVHIEYYANIFNYSRSSWEPLIEPCPISIYANCTTNKKLYIEIVSRQLVEVTVTSRSVALLSQISNLITSDEKLKPRGEDKPYLIVNETGYDISVWAEPNNKTLIKSREVIPWTFEDWRKIRENLDVDNAGTLSISFLDSSYLDLHNISASNEGEELYMLQPPIDGVHSRLVVDIVLREDNIKVIRLRSTILVENDADIPLSIEVSYGSQKYQLTIDSKDCKALPIDSVYTGQIRVSPKIQTHYGWSEVIYWKDVIKNGTSLTCQGEDSKYYFQAEATYDKDEPLARIYPHLRLIISSPLEIENLLPFDLDYRLYDKNSKRDWTGCITKGVKSHIHVVSLDNLLLLSVLPKNIGYQKSEFAIINKSNEFNREDTIGLRNNNNVLKLKIFYPRKQAGSSSLKVVIYSPYVILNRTSLDLLVCERGNNSSTSLSSNTPTMFSFDKFGDPKNRAVIRSDDSTWSEPMSFDAIGQSNELKLQVVGKQMETNLGINIQEGEGKYNLTKVVTITPRYILINKLEETLQIVENGTTRRQQTNIQPGQSIPLYGLRNIEKKNILIKFIEGCKSWSPPFSIDEVGQLFIKIFKSNIGGQVLIKVTILIENATIFIHFENGNNQWPYSIRNFTDEEFFIYQNDPNINSNGEVVSNDTPYKPIYYKIPAKSVMPYAYDYPNAIIKELIVRSHGRERAVNLAEIGNLRPFRLPQVGEDHQCIVDLNVVADGPTQSLIITNYDPSTSLYKLQGASGSKVNNSDRQFEAVENDENYYTKIVCKLDGFGISFINTRNQELLYATLKGIEFRYNESNLYQTLSCKLKWVQVDNQLYGGIFPIIIYPSVIPKTGRELNNHPSFSGSICRVKDESHGVLFIKYATILLQEMSIEIDEDFLFALLEFSKFPGASWNKNQLDILYEENHQILPQPKSKIDDTNDIYFEALHLQPIQANLSFVRTERINAEDKGSSQNTLMFFFNVLTMAIGNINDAPIQLNTLFLENIRVPTPILMQSIQTHYSQAFFYQLHNILGSADFLGNPVGLFNQLSSGVLDIFYEPYQGFVLNDRPQELGIGIAKGGLSFVKKSIFGFSDSIAKVTGSIAKGLTVVTMDEKFQQQRRRLNNSKRNKPKHALYGFASGANSFIDSISSGFAGIATAPMEGANEEGAAGFFKGLGKGIIGLPTKTAIGFFDLASNVSEGIRNTTTVFDGEGLDKVRLPRYVYPNSVIKPYSVREARGQYWMHNIDESSFFEEVYLAHLVLAGEEKCILVTFKKIIMFDINQLVSKWIIGFDQVKSITVESTGLVIGLKSTRGNGTFIPIPERSNRNFLYQKMVIAVEEFNKHCKVVL
ncbi:Vacuolar protein sorting-associated protein 13 [Spathaspora sp. JA1]|nr:Vacuolar protein sorting-associated protein 13 [Spathaspora sp. JA1]